MKMLALAGALVLGLFVAAPAQAGPAGAPQPSVPAVTTGSDAEPVTYRYRYRYGYRPFVYGYYARPRVFIGPRFYGVYRPYRAYRFH